MADAGTTPDVPVVMDGDVIVEFNEASSRQQINSGESVKTLFGKIRKFLTDLKAVAFSGAYSDLSGVPDLSEYAKKADIRNENLLINPDFKINQRGNTDFSVDYHIGGSPIPQSQKYTVDRWRIMDGEANISNGKFTLTGTIIQVLENSIGGDFTASVSVESGTATASYDDSTKTFSIVGNNAVLNWAKLEYGSVATSFVSPDTATELLKCKRFYRTLSSGTLAHSSGSNSAVFSATFDIPMRVKPDIKILSSVKLTYCSGWIDEPNVSDMSIVSYDISNMGVCYIHVRGFNMTVNGAAFADNSSFRAETDNFIGLDAEIY